ncbi:hypothetical protein KJ059_14955 [Myxococcota bacterium]|nr:hypothetical protein [Myxococcota bacterium]MCZ7617661.1 hypothetical protein [Myxococcota bacterium]
MAARKTSSRKTSARKASSRKTSSRKPTARKSTARKGGARRKTGTAGRLGAALERLDLPPTLRDYAAQVRKRLDGLERELSRASTDVRRQAAKLLREASHQLGRLEARGEVGWRRLTQPYRRQLLQLLGRLEKAVAPKPARKKRTRKAVRRTRQVIEEAAAAVDDRVG